MVYDQIVIGAGIAGLYWIYKSQSKTFLILEKSDRIGGRIYNVDWYGHQISLGGGIIKSNNIYTINLAKELDLELGSAISKYNLIDLVNYPYNIDDATENNFYESNKTIIKYLKKIYKNNKQEILDKKLNWNEFLEFYLDIKVSQTIKSNLLYQTYGNADPESVLYGEMDELLRTTDFEIKFIKDSGYTSLLTKLINIIKTTNIKLNTFVVKIKKDNDIFYIYTNSNQIFQSKKIILATEARNNIKFELGLDNNLTNKLNNLYNMVSGSNYIRIYSYHKNNHGLTSSYRTSGLPGKVIFINKQILMCCYTEDYQASELFKLLNKNSKKNQIEIIYKLLSNSNIKISKPDDIIIQFWNNGVHYNKPGYDIEKKNNIINELAKSNIIVIGEAISNSHGWVNSALESVEFILKNEPK